VLIGGIVTASPIASFKGGLALLEINGASESETWPFIANSGLVLQGIHGVADGTVFVGGGGESTFWRSNTQPFFHYKITDGYSLYEHATLEDLFVPYGADGNPLVITPPAGYTLTANVPRDAALSGILESKLYSDGLGFVDVSYADYLQWISYSDGFTWAKFNADCLVTDSVITDYLDGSQFDEMDGWKGSGSCGAGTAVLEVDIEGEYTLDIDGHLIITTP